VEAIPFTGRSWKPLKMMKTKVPRTDKFCICGKGKKLIYLSEDKQND
jgi:hypothetical protein